VCTLLLSLDRFLKYTSVNVKSSGLALSSSSVPSNATLSQLRAVLSVLLTPGLSPDIDEICKNRLGTSPSPSTVGFASYVNCHSGSAYNHLSHALCPVRLLPPSTIMITPFTLGQCQQKFLLIASSRSSRS
jgi:hypothetical protein